MQQTPKPTNVEIDAMIAAQLFRLAADHLSDLADLSMAPPKSGDMPLSGGEQAAQFQSLLARSCQAREFAALASASLSLVAQLPESE